jgi:hypothetical protein
MIDLLPALYERDETAWLEAMAELARDGRAEDLDLGHLADYLFDMARRDRREVEGRLAVLLSHLLKWTDQPDHRSRGWRATVIEQRQELNRLASRGVLRNHAQEVLADVYTEAVERAAAETGVARDRFPAECPYTLDELLTLELPEADA